MSVHRIISSIQEWARKREKLVRKGVVEPLGPLTEEDKEKIKRDIVQRYIRGARERRKKIPDELVQDFWF